MQFGEKWFARHPLRLVVYRCSLVLVVLMVRLVSIELTVLDVILVVTLFILVWCTRLLMLGLIAMVRSRVLSYFLRRWKTLLFPKTLVRARSLMLVLS